MTKRTPEDKETLTAKYNDINKKVKRLARRDKKSMG